jgi:hypothetical protein
MNAFAIGLSMNGPQPPPLPEWAQFLVCPPSEVQQLAGVPLPKMAKFDASTPTPEGFNLGAFEVG